MSSVGHKVKGVMQVVHGMGDNIRGTTLGAVDTVTSSSSGETKNDLLAQKGRQEIQEGLTNIKGVGYDEKQIRKPEHGPVPVTQNPQPRVEDSMTNPIGTSNQTREATGEFPQHHRDDAISNDPKAIAVGQKFVNSEEYNGAAASDLPAPGLPPEQVQSKRADSTPRPMTSPSYLPDTTGNGFYHEKPAFPIGPDVQHGSEQQSDLHL